MLKECNNQDLDRNEISGKYYLFFRNFDIDFFAPMVYNKTKGVRRCHSVAFKTTE